MKKAYKVSWFLLILLLLAAVLPASLAADITFFNFKLEGFNMSIFGDDYTTSSGGLGFDYYNGLVYHLRLHSAYKMGTWGMQGIMAEIGLGIPFAKKEGYSRSGVRSGPDVSLHLFDIRMRLYNHTFDDLDRPESLGHKGYFKDILCFLGYSLTLFGENNDVMGVYTQVYFSAFAYLMLGKQRREDLQRSWNKTTEVYEGAGTLLKQDAVISGWSLGVEFTGIGFIGKITIGNYGGLFMDVSGGLGLVF